MHRKIMRFMVDFSLVVGIIVSILIASAVGTAVDNGGLSFLVFIVSLIIIEMGLAGEGMKVEQAENIAKIARNTERLLDMKDGAAGSQYSGYTGSGETSMLSRALASDGVPAPNSTVTTPPAPTIVAPPSKWTCKKCFEENAASSRFCMNCGNKKSY